MRLDWVSGSAAALIIGSFTLVLGFLLNPLSQERTVAESMRAADVATSQWVASSGALFVASVGMTLGLPALLALVARQSRKLGMCAFAVFAVGTIGMSGYGFAMVFLRAMMLEEPRILRAVDDITGDPAVQAFVGTWLACFMMGVALFAVAMLRAGTVPRWVPALMLLFVASQAVPGIAGDIGTVIQFLALAVALTGASMSAHGAAVTEGLR